MQFNFSLVHTVTDLQHVHVKTVPGLPLVLPRPATVSGRGGSAHGDVPPQTDGETDRQPASLSSPLLT